MRSTPSSTPSPSGRKSTSKTGRSGWACREDSGLSGLGVLETVRATIRQHAMLTGGETVLVAVSGGADSVALLHVLMTLADEVSLRLHVLHVDHGLRTDSVRDAEFVRQLAERLAVPAE